MSMKPALALKAVEAAEDRAAEDRVAEDRAAEDRAAAVGDAISTRHPYLRAGSSAVHQ